MPAGLDLAAYRVVQEALTNAFKHAGPARAAVTVRYEPGRSSWRSSTTGAGPPSTSSAPSAAATAWWACASASALYGGERRGGPRAAAAGSPCAPGSPSATRRWPDERSASSWSTTRQLIRAGFRMILDAEPDIEVVGECADGAQAVDSAAPARRPTSCSWTSACRRWTASRRPAGSSASGDGPAGRVLMLTTFDLDEYVYDALRAGASGFLLKDVPADQLADGIRVVAAGRGAARARRSTRRLIHEFARTSPARREPPPAIDELTPRELEVFAADRARAVERRDRRRSCSWRRPP